MAAAAEAESSTGFGVDCSRQATPISPGRVDCSRQTTPISPGSVDFSRQTSPGGSLSPPPCAAAPCDANSTRALPRRKFLEVSALIESCDDAGKVCHVVSTSSLPSLKEAARFCGRATPRVSALVRSRNFTLSIAALIVLNAMYIGVETEMIDNELDTDWPWVAVEAFFTLVFFIELCLRYIASKPREFVADSWNIFDLLLVMGSCVDTFVLANISWNLDVVSSMRTVRLIRIIRVFRLLRFFRELWALVAGITEASITLMWTWLLMLLIIYVCGIFVTRTIGQPNRAHSSDLDEYFGSVPRSMFSLFQIMTTEGWAGIARQAMESEPWSAAFFILYFYATTCAVLNVVVAVIVENTLDQAGAQREKHQSKVTRSQKEACVKIHKVFRAVDTDGNGVLTQDEFLQAIRQEDVTSYLHQLGIDMRQAENLFSILDHDESGCLDADEFVGGLMKATGTARSKDVLAIQCDLWRSEDRVVSRLGEVLRRAHRQMRCVEKGCAEIQEDLRYFSRKLGVAKKPVMASVDSSVGCQTAPGQPVAWNPTASQLPCPPPGQLPIPPSPRGLAHLNPFP